jgi:arylsulfatase A-like enzyme
MDTEIGRLLAAVDLAKTTVIFVGDNGTPNQVLQTPFPAARGKDTLYQGGICVPMIIRGPDVVSPGRTSDVFTHVVDLYSTILDLAGIPVTTTVPTNVTLDSQSLLPVLQNQSAARSRLYAEQFDSSAPTSGGRVLRDESYKLIRKNTGTEEFYDLQTDPYESTNLLAGGVNAMTPTQQSYYYRLRFNLGRYTAATAPIATDPGLSAGGFMLTVPQAAGATQTLWRCDDLADGFWAPVNGATTSVNGSNITFTDPAPPVSPVFYSVLTESP